MASLIRVREFEVANEQPPVLDFDIVVENRLRRAVHVDNKSVPVEGDRGEPHRVERGGRRSRRSARSRDSRDFDQTPGEGSKNAFFFSAQVADLGFFFQNSHFAPVIS